MSLTFTKTDKALLDRAARHLKAAAQDLANADGQNWAFDEESRQNKREYDRLLRDERDLRAMAKRLQQSIADLKPTGPNIVPLNFEKNV